jgi:hypothetical protein
MTNVNANDIKEHASVIASCGTEIGKVDHLEGQDSIKLTRSDDEHNEHHLIPLSWAQRKQVFVPFKGLLYWFR